MTLLATVPINNFTGSATSPAVAVPSGATNVTVDFDGTFMTDSALHVDTSIEFAPDGVTWQLAGGSNFQGGGHNRQGQPLAVYSFNCDIPQTGETPKLRGSLTVSGALLTTVLHISTT